MIGAPLDSAGRGEGEERAPEALRRAGLLEGLAAHDRGDIDTRIDDPRREPGSGVIGFAQVERAARELADAVASAVADDARPLVLGGDCTLLIGAVAGARRGYAGSPIGLAFLDAHLDFYDGDSSPTGECADMDLAILTGGGPSELAAIAGERPIVNADRVVAAGFRPEPDPGTVPAGEFILERDLVDRRIEVIEAAAIEDPGRIGTAIESRLAADEGRFWLHLDADLLDPEQMPAVSYPEPGGLSWEEAAALLAAPAASPALIGASVADLNVDRDPDGACARRLAELVRTALAA